MSPSFLIAAGWLPESVFWLLLGVGLVLVVIGVLSGNSG